MLKRVLKRSASLLLAIVMLASLFPAITLSVAAAESNSVDGVKVSGEFAESSGVFTFRVEPTTSSGCSGETTTSKTKSLTITNIKGKTGILKFSYTVTLSGGSVTVDGVSKNAGTGTFEKELEAGGAVTISVASGGNKGNYGQIELENISLAVNENITTTFLPVTEGGSYAVDGKAVNGTYTHTKNATETTTMVATPAPGYKFFGWYSVTDSTYLSKTASWTTSLTKEQTIKAVFAPSTAPTFQVGAGNEFFDLNEAVDFAKQSNQNTIVLIADGTVPAGDYTIPSGKTLLIPFDDAHTLYTNEPEVIYNSYTAPTAYRTLMLSDGAKIDVDTGGAISVSSKLSAIGVGASSKNGTPTGAGGRMILNNGSGITLQDGAALYCYGFISGAGTVTAESGAQVWECFQITSWRGGTASSNMVGNESRVFPLPQYYVQNIESKLIINAGAKEYVYTSANTRLGAHPGSGLLIGDSEGLFRITNGSLTKYYDGDTDRLIMEFSGDGEVSAMQVTVKITINSSDYVLPINNNISICVNSGTVTFCESAALLPGAELIVAEGAEVVVNKNLFVYDADQWDKNYGTNGAQIVQAPYSVATAERKTTPAAVRPVSALSDAVVDINGTLKIAGSGALYTTQSGAEIISSQGMGTVLFNTAAGTETTTYQATYENGKIVYNSIPVTPAQLQNQKEGVESTQTDDALANDTFVYNEGVWHKSTVGAENEENHPHHVVTDAAVEATCDTPGKTEGSHCDICGKVLEEQETIPVDPDAHDYAFSGWSEWSESNGNWTIDAVLKCSHDQTHTKNESVTAVKNADKSVAVGHLTDGKDVYTATYDGRTIDKEIVVPAEGHKWSDAWSKDDNYHWHTCPGCDEVNSKAAHDWGEGVVTTEPTCTEKGVKTFTCSVCGATRTEEIPADRHEYTKIVWGEWTEDYTITAAHVCEKCNENTEGHSVALDATVSHSTTKPAACETDGVETYTATVTVGGKTHTCDKTAEKVIPALEHDYSEFVRWTDWTDTHTIQAVLRCTHCGNETNVDANVSEPGVKMVATCTQSGVVTYTATVTVNGIDVTTSADVTTGVDLTNHIHTTETKVKAATCVAKGNRAYWTCDACGKHFAEETCETPLTEAEIETEIDPDNHANVVTDAADGATCDTPGKTEGSHCDACGTVIKAQEEIAALGHAYDMENVKWQWNEYESAVATLTCSRQDCDHAKVVTVTDIETDTKPATCTEDGETVYTATVTEGGKTASGTKTETLTKLDHNTEGMVAHKDATCTEEGVVGGTYCTRCGEGQAAVEATIPMLAHNKDGKVEHKDATCTEEGVVGGTYCTVCGEGKISAETVIPKISHKDAVKTEAKASTCTATGNNAYWICPDCGKVFKDNDNMIGDETTVEAETIAKKAHSYTSVVTTPATCTTKGVETFTCEECKDTYTQEVAIDTNAHVWSDWYVETEASCEKGSTEVRTCANCGKTERRNNDDQWNHSLNHVPASCRGEGNIEHWVCEHCGKFFADVNATQELTDHEITIGAPAHKWSEWTESQAATCERSGEETRACEVCGEVDTRNIPALSHRYGEPVWLWELVENEDGALEWTVTATFACIHEGCENEVVFENDEIHVDYQKIDATCTGEGVEVYTATVKFRPAEDAEEQTYTKSMGFVVDDATGHVYSAEQDAADWTWTEDETGAWVVTATFTCTECGEKLVVDMDGENITDEVTTKATCTVKGEQTYTAKVTVGDVEYTSQKVADIEPLGHDIVEHAARKVTCTDNGYDAYETCSRCDYSTKGEDIAALGHAYDEGVITTEPTCTAEGVKTFTCTREGCTGDGHTETEPVAKRRHQMVFSEGVAPTCEEDGHYAYYTCLTCDDLFSDEDGLEHTTLAQKRIPAAGHSYVPTWTWTGNTAATVTLTCDKCGKQETVTATVSSNIQGNTTTYTAVAMFEGKTYQDVKTVTVTPPGGGGTGGNAGGDINIDDVEVPLADILPFVDVPDDFWGRDDIATVYHKGLMMGLDDGSIFAPHMSTTRGMIVTILYRIAEGNTAVEEIFDDVNNASWYSEAVTWGTKNDVIAGYGDGRFGPNDEITREQLVAILWRYMGKPVAKGAALPFSDADQVSDYAREAMQWALEQGIISGKSETVLDPQGHATRAETAAILSRYLKLTEAEK